MFVFSKTAIVLAVPCQFSSSQAQGGEYHSPLTDGVVAVEVGPREPLTHFQRLSHEDGDHGLEAEFLEICEVPLVLKPSEYRSKVFYGVGHFGAKSGFAANERGGVGEGQSVAVVVFGVTEG